MKSLSVRLRGTFKRCIIDKWYRETQMTITWNHNRYNLREQIGEWVMNHFFTLEWLINCSNVENLWFSISKIVFCLNSPGNRYTEAIQYMNFTDWKHKMVLKNGLTSPWCTSRLETGCEHLVIYKYNEKYMKYNPFYLGMPYANFKTRWFYSITRTYIILYWW